MFPGPLKQVGEGKAGRSGDTASGINTEEQWDHQVLGRTVYLWKSIFFLQEIHFFSDTQRHRAGMCAQKWFMTCRGGALYLIRDREAQDHLQ